MQDNPQYQFISDNAKAASKKFGVFSPLNPDCADGGLQLLRGDRDGAPARLL
jgi:hypothetical protein